MAGGQGGVRGQGQGHGLGSGIGFGLGSARVRAEDARLISANFRPKREPTRSHHGLAERKEADDIDEAEQHHFAAVKLLQGGNVLGTGVHKAALGPR